jgi:hypothetical protein
MQTPKIKFLSFETDESCLGPDISISDSLYWGPNGAFHLYVSTTFFFFSYGRKSVMHVTLNDKSLNTP